MIVSLLILRHRGSPMIVANVVQFPPSQTSPARSHRLHSPSPQPQQDSTRSATLGNRWQHLLERNPTAAEMLVKSVDHYLSVFGV